MLKAVAKKSKIGAEIGMYGLSSRGSTQELIDTEGKGSPSRREFVRQSFCLFEELMPYVQENRK